MIANPNRKCCIYALKDPNTLEIRYVGKSTKVHARLGEHYRDNHNKERFDWIHQLWDNNQLPIIEILEVVAPDSQWQYAEQWWIAHFKNLGAPLFNKTLGGGGTRGVLHTEEFKAMLGNRYRGKKLSSETCAKMSASMKGRPNSELCRQKTRERMLGKPGYWTGKKMSDTHRQAIREGQAKFLTSNPKPYRHTPEIKVKLSALMKKRWESIDPAWVAKRTEHTREIIKAKKNAKL